MLSVEQLSMGRGGRMIVADVEFAIGAGCALQIHGANGCGKTTLLRLVAGLLKPTAGSVRWHGENVCAQTERFRRDVAYVGHTCGLSDDLTVLENLRFAALLGADAAGVDAAYRAYGAAEHETGVLERGGLAPLQHTRLGQLSQGQRRRVALARVMLGRKPLWLLDEPAEALDSEGQTWLCEGLAKHLQNGGMVVATTHRPLATDTARTWHLFLGPGRQ